MTESGQSCNPGLQPSCKFDCRPELQPRLQIPLQVLAGLHPLTPPLKLASLTLACRQHSIWTCMCSLSTLLDRTSTSFDSLWRDYVLEKVGFMLETKPSFFEATTTPPSVMPVSENFASYKHGSCLVQWVEVQGHGLDNSPSQSRNTLDCIRIASSIAVELQLRVASSIASPGRTQTLHTRLK